MRRSDRSPGAGAGRFQILSREQFSTLIQVSVVVFGVTGVLERRPRRSVLDAQLSPRSSLWSAPSSSPARSSSSSRTFGTRREHEHRRTVLTGVPRARTAPAFWSGSSRGICPGDRVRAPGSARPYPAAADLGRRCASRRARATGWPGRAWPQLRELVRGNGWRVFAVIFVLFLLIAMRPCSFRERWFTGRSRFDKPADGNVLVCCSQEPIGNVVIDL